MKHLTAEEVKAIIQHIDKPRQRLMVLVAFYHGLRISELINLKGRDIQDGYVSVQRLKGSLKTIQAFITSHDPEMDEAEPLTMLSVTTKMDELVFPMTRNGFHKLIRRAGTAAGIPQHKLHAHALKHGCAMILIKKGIEYTRQHLGHRSISSTGEYLRVSDEQASKAAQEAFFGD